MSDFLWEKSYPKGVKWEIEIEEKPVYALLDEAVAKWPNNYAIDFMDKRITYAELDDMVDRAAKGFRELGVKEGVHVGLYLPNTPHYMVCFFGILKAGGTVVNYSPLDAERELRHKIGDSHTDFMVTLDLEVLYPKIAGMLKETRLKKIIVGCLKEVLPFPKTFLYPSSSYWPMMGKARPRLLQIPPRKLRFCNILAGRLDCRKAQCLPIKT